MGAIYKLERNILGIWDEGVLDAYDDMLGEVRSAITDGILDADAHSLMEKLGSIYPTSDTE